jgi:hypothetical protein
MDNYIKLYSIIKGLQDKDDFIKDFEIQLKDKILEKVIIDFNEKNDNLKERQKLRDENRCNKCGRRDDACYC